MRDQPLYPPGYLYNLDKNRYIWSEKIKYISKEILYITFSVLRNIYHHPFEKCNFGS